MSDWLNRLHAKRMAACVLASVALLAVAMASITQAVKAPFKVLIVFPLSGPLSQVGKTEAAGSRAAATIINRQGGVLGSRVEVTFRDDAGDGAKGTATALQEIASTSYNMVTCGATLAQALPCAAAIDKTKPLKIVSGQDPSFNKLSRTFGVGPLYDPSGENLVRHLIRKKVKAFAVIAADNASGQTGAAAIEASAKRHSKQIRVTRKILVPPAVADATPYIQQATSSGAQAIAATAFSPAGLQVLRARKKLGVTLPVYTDWLFASASLSSLTAEERAGVTTQVFPWMIKGSKATKKKAFADFIREYDKEIAGPSPLAVTAPVTGANLLYVARAAARTAKSTDPDKMVRAMAKLTKSSKVPGFIGVSTLYSKRSHNPRGNPAKDWTFVRAGTIGTDGFITPDK